MNNRPWSGVECKGSNKKQRVKIKIKNKIEC